MTRIVHDTRETAVSTQAADGTLWLNATEVQAATGWDWKPQGLCRDDACMPVPHNSGQPLVDGERIDIAAFWRHAGWPVVHDDAQQLWVLGEGAATRGDALASLQAPDFELPDLQGRMHRLSDLRGQRVFMATWASW